MTMIVLNDKVIGSIITNHSMTVDALISTSCPNVKPNNPDETGDFGDYALYDGDGEYCYSFNANDICMMDVNYDEDLGGATAETGDHKYAIQYASRRGNRNDFGGVDRYSINKYWVHDCDCLSWVDGKEVYLEDIPVSVRVAMLEAMPKADPVIYDCAAYRICDTNEIDSTDGFDAMSIDELKNQFSDWCYQLQQNQEDDPTGNYWSGDIELVACWDSANKEETYIEF